MDKITIGISSCLLGNKVRYDGGHKLDPFLTGTLGRYVDWVPVCPEAACGLGIPRETMHLVGDPEEPRLVTVRTGRDHTARITRWAKERTAELEHEGLCGFVFKARSPSCGVRDTKIFDAKCRTRGRGPGVFARAVMARFPHLPVEDEGRLHDPVLRENFIVRVFTYRRWQEYVRKDGSLGGLAAFHRDHECLLMAHSRTHAAALDRLLKGAKKGRRGKLHADYLKMLMEALRKLATPTKNTGVLRHMAGYFKDTLSTDEQRELHRSISNYRDGLEPLVVPMTLLKHYARTRRKRCFATQAYLTPHPLELMLRNHM